MTILQSHSLIHLQAFKNDQAHAYPAFTFLLLQALTSQYIGTWQ